MLLKAAKNTKGFLLIKYLIEKQNFDVKFKDKDANNCFLFVGSYSSQLETLDYLLKNKKIEHYSKNKYGIGMFLKTS